MLEAPGKLESDLVTVLTASEALRPICAYLYGSRARGGARPDSDVDLAVLPAAEVKAGPFGPLGDLKGELEERLSMPVDVLDLRTATADVVHRVLRDGVLLLETDPAARVAYEVARRNEYFDLLPYLRAYRRGGAA